MLIQLKYDINPDSHWISNRFKALWILYLKSSRPPPPPDIAKASVVVFTDMKSSTNIHAN